MMTAPVERQPQRLAEQLPLDLCPTCGQPMPPKPEPLRCAHCGEVMTEDDVYIHNDLGKFCADSTCVQAAFRTLL